MLFHRWKSKIWQTFLSLSLSLFSSLFLIMLIIIITYWFLILIQSTKQPTISYDFFFESIFIYSSKTNKQTNIRPIWFFIYTQKYTKPWESCHFYHQCFFFVFCGSSSIYNFPDYMNFTKSFTKKMKTNFFLKFFI